MIATGKICNGSGGWGTHGAGGGGASWTQKAECPFCKRQIGLKRDSTLRRHVYRAPKPPKAVSR